MFLIYNCNHLDWSFFVNVYRYWMYISCSNGLNVNIFNLQINTKKEFWQQKVMLAKFTHFHSFSSGIFIFHSVLLFTNSYLHNLNIFSIKYIFHATHYDIIWLKQTCRHNFSLSWLKEFFAWSFLYFAFLYYY